MPDIVTGVRDTGNILSNKIVVDMSNEIALLNPNANPFMRFLKISKRNQRIAQSPKIEWMEDDLNPIWDKVNNSVDYDDEATSITVTNGDYFSKGDIVKVPVTGEVLLVTAISTNALTITRGYGTTVAGAIKKDDPLVIIGNANEEGSGTRTIKTTKEVPKYNYTQIIKTPFGVTNTEAATKMYGGKDLSYQQKKKGIEHTRSIEHALLLGERKLDTSGDAPKRTAGGFLEFATKNNYDASGELTESEFDNNVAEVVFQYGSEEKILLASARLISVINAWGKGKMEINNLAAKYGIRVFQYVTPFGVFQIMNMSHVLKGATYGGYGLVVDPENVKYAPLKGRDTKLETNIQANDIDARKDQYITEASIEIRQPDTHGVITGVTG